MAQHSHPADDKNTPKILRRMTLSAHSVTLPDGLTLDTKVDLQEDGGVYVSQMVRRDDGGIIGGQTCFYCDEKKLGCITCPTGQSASGNCVTGTLSCVRNDAIHNWNPASLVFKNAAPLG